MQIELELNGRATMLRVGKTEFLSEALRRQGLLSVRKGCDTSCCGICSIWLDGRPTLSCSLLAIRAAGRSVTTIEGVAAKAQEFAEILAAEGAEQCGFCSPGFIMTVLALKREMPQATEAEINAYLKGNLCRCTGYMGQLRAVKTYLGRQSDEDCR